MARSSKGKSSAKKRPAKPAGARKLPRPKPPSKKSAKKVATPRAGRASPAALKKAALSAAAVLVIGDHPAAAFCAMLLHEAEVPVALVDIGTTPGSDRLVTINPAFFQLHKVLADLSRRLDLSPVTYARFLGPKGESAVSQPRRAEGAKRADVLAYVGSMRELRDVMRAAALAAGVPRVSGPLEAEDVDERGAHLRVQGQRISVKLLAVADPLPDETAAILDVPRFPGRGSSVQATAGLTGPNPLFGSGADTNAQLLALDLGGALQWGWLLRRRDEAQVCIQCQPDADVPALMEEWTALLRRQQILVPDAQPDLRTLRVSDLPLAGALMRDVVARRTLLFGPAGGFYSACGEDVYPACWSAKYAAEIAARAVKADHPQDALGAYRGRWGSTLGDYLRGPQQNLRFLLPLLYKNPVMTERLAEAIFLGRSLVK